MTIDTIDSTQINAYIPQPKQLAFQQSPHRYKLYGGSMGGGKSRTLCEEMVRQMVIYPGNRGLLVRATLVDFYLSTYITLTEEVIPGYIEAGIVTENKQKRYFDFHLPGARSRLYYGGLDLNKQEREKYFSTQYGCIGIDEAREIGENDFKKLGTRLRHKLQSHSPNWDIKDSQGMKLPAYHLLLASNPSQNWLKTYFILTHNPKYLFVPALPRENKYNPPDYEEQIRDLFHGDTAFINAYLEGSWDSVSSIDDLIVPTDLHPLFDKEIYSIHDRRLTSLDLARMGDDMTSIYNFHNSMVVSQEYYGKKDTMETLGRLMYNREKNKSRAVSVGFNGMDQVFYDRLNEVNGEMSRPFFIFEMDFEKTSSQPQAFYNLRAEVYWYLRGQIKNGLCSVPRDDIQLHAQLSTIKYKFKGGKKGTRILIESKKEIKKRLGCSPDKADAYAIGIFNMQYCPIDTDKPTWKDEYKDNTQRVGCSGMSG